MVTHTVSAEVRLVVVMGAAAKWSAATASLCRAQDVFTIMPEAGQCSLVGLLKLHSMFDSAGTVLAPGNATVRTWHTMLVGVWSLQLYRSLLLTSESHARQAATSRLYNASPSVCLS